MHTNGICSTSTSIMSVEQVTGWRQKLSDPAQAVLLELLSSTVPASLRGASPFKPIWVNEAMYRAVLVTRLVQLRDTKMANKYDASHVLMAQRISEYFIELAEADDRRLTRYSDLVRGLTFHLVSLLAPATSANPMVINIEDTILPAYRRRALALATCALLMQDIQFSCENGINVSSNLTLTCDNKNGLRLCISGMNLHIYEEDRRQILDDLISILNGKMVHSDSIAEIVFHPFM